MRFGLYTTESLSIGSVFLATQLALNLWPYVVEQPCVVLQSVTIVGLHLRSDKCMRWADGRHQQHDEADDIEPVAARIPK